MGCADSKSTQAIEKQESNERRSSRKVSPEAEALTVSNVNGAVPNGAVVNHRRGHNTRAIESLHGPIGSVQEPQRSTAVRTTRRVSSVEDDSNTTVIKFTPAKVHGESAEITITQSRASTAAIDKIDVNVTPAGEIMFSITPTSAMRDDTPTNGNVTPYANKPGMLPNDVLAQIADKLKNKSWYEALVSLGLNLDEIKAIENVLVAKACFNQWKKFDESDDIDKLEILENVLDSYQLDVDVFGKYNGKDRLSDKGLFCLCKNIRKEWYGIVTDLGLEAKDVSNIQMQCRSVVIFQLLKMWNRTYDDKSKKLSNLLNVLYEYNLKTLAADLKRQFLKTPKPKNNSISEENIE